MTVEVLDEEESAAAEISGLYKSTAVARAVAVVAAEPRRRSHILADGAESAAGCPLFGSSEEFRVYRQYPKQQGDAPSLSMNS